MLKILVVLFIFAAFGNVFAQNQSDDEARAKAFIDALAVKDFAAAYDFFADEVKAKLPIEAMPQLWGQINGQFGDFKSQGKIIKIAIPNGEKIATICEFEKSSIAISTAFDKNGKIQGFFFEDPQTLSAKAGSKKETPKYETPNYAVANSFTETDVTVGAGEWALPATLTMPKGKTNVPAIVLVHGSGPGDRDESHGSNKTFKDLAWGLASEGIAVLRYDKRTLVHGGKFIAVKNFTVNEETVEDALLAAALLRKTANVDAKKVYLLGHSLGGYIFPRIAQKDEKISGFVSLAGGVQPLEDIILEQNIYLASLDGSISKEDETEIANVKKTLAEIKNLKAADAAAERSFFGLPVSYWYDLQSYRPLEIAAKIKRPMLILQGESDFQVTMKDYEMSKAALGKRKNVTLKSYPNLTHLFMERNGAGKPGIADYEQPNHVSAQVVKDIADWILKTAK